MPNSDGYPSDSTDHDLIPVLTEVIVPGQVDSLPDSLPTTEHSPVVPAPYTPTHVAEPHAPTTPKSLRLTDEEWEQLQRKLSERILHQLQGRVDFVLEQRIRDSLADVLQIAMIGLTNEIKNGLQHTLEDVISRAVAQEITRLQTGKK